MSKDDNERKPATAAIRRLASDIAAGRRHQKEWGKWVDRKREQLLAEAGGEVDVTFVTPAPDKLEVVSITESKPIVSYDYKSFFANHPELQAALEMYRKPATTNVVVTTSWVEQAEEQPPTAT